MSDFQLLSINTDSITMQMPSDPGAAARIESVIEQWQKDAGLTLERTEIVRGRRMNVNSYIYILSDGSVKSKGLLACDPGMNANPDNLAINWAVRDFLIDETSPRESIEKLAAARDLFAFSSVHTTKSNFESRDHQGRVVEQYGNVIRVYKTNDPAAPTLYVNALDGQGEKRVAIGFRAFDDLRQWPEDLDLEWYIGRAQEILDHSSVRADNETTAIARRIEAAGFSTVGIGGSPGVRTGGNFSGSRAIGVKFSKSLGVIALPDGLGTAASIALKYTGGALHVLSQIEGGLARVKKQARAQGIELAASGVALVWGDGVEFDRDSLRPVGKVAQSMAGQTEAAGDGGAAPDPADVSIEEFLSVLFEEDQEEAFVTTSRVAPDEPDRNLRRGMWFGGPVMHARGRHLDAEGNNYVSISTFTPNAEGVYSRRKIAFKKMHVLMLDDIATKAADPAALGFGPPTAVIETSPGNYQYIYKLARPIEDANLAEALIRGALSNEVLSIGDAGSGGVNRVFRLPVGVNNKLKYGARPWQVRLVQWRPEASYEADQIAAWLGIEDLGQEAEKLVSAHAAAGPQGAADEAAAMQAPVVVAFDEMGHLLADGPNARGWIDVLCPWWEDHTHRDQSGTGILVREDGGWTFNCFHGHCQGERVINPGTARERRVKERGSYAVWQWLRDHGKYVARANQERRGEAFEAIQGRFAVDPETGEVQSVKTAREAAMVDMGFSNSQPNGSEAGAGNRVADTWLSAAQAILERLARALGMQAGDLARAINFRPQAVGEILAAAAWHPEKGKFFIMRAGLRRAGVGEFGVFMDRLFAPIYDPVALADIVREHCAQITPASARKRETDRLMGLAKKELIDTIKVGRQFTTMGLLVDPFAHQERIEIRDGTAMLHFLHTPFAERRFDARIVNDYQAHFPEFEELLRLLVASRFAADRKQAYLWIRADSNWGKTVLLNCLAAHGLVVQTSVAELDKIFGGGPVGKTVEDFLRAWILAIDEFKAVCREVKQISDSMPINPKGLPAVVVPLYLKIFFSAESVKSLVSDEGLIEDQFANRFTMIDAAGKRLDDRPLFNQDKGRYLGHIQAFIGQFINQEMARYVSMGEDEARRAGDEVIATFYARHRIDQSNKRRMNDAILDMTDDFIAWVMGCCERRKSGGGIGVSISREDMYVSDRVEFDQRRQIHMLRGAHQVFDMWLSENFDKSEVGTISFKKGAIFSNQGGIRARKVNKSLGKWLPLVNIGRGGQKFEDDD